MADYEYARDNSDREIVETEEERGTNWLPLLLIPIALALGWWGKDMVDNNTSNRDLSYRSSPQVGVGGGPVSPIPCTTPAIENQR